jgi:DNA polymerase-3 subunit alpha
MDREILETHGDGLIAINGHLGSELAFHLVQATSRRRTRAHWEAAVEVCEWHRRVFKPTRRASRGSTSSCSTMCREQIAINPHLIRLAREQDLPLVCDNDSHFLLERGPRRARHADLHLDRARVKTTRSADEVHARALRQEPGADVGALRGRARVQQRRVRRGGREALRNTKAIADRCDVELPIGANHAPVVVVKSAAQEQAAEARRRRRTAAI